MQKESSQENIVLSIFDDKFINHAIRMYRSFRFHDQVTKLYAGSIDLSEKSIKKLNRIGVEVLDFLDKKIPKSLCLCDLMMHDYLRGLDWKKAMWIDADTIVLRPVSHLFKMDYDFICHGGGVEIGFFDENPAGPYPFKSTWISRRVVGDCLVEDCKWGKFFAMGLWVATPEVARDFRLLLDQNMDATFEGDICSEMLNERYKTLQLNGFEWSLGTMQNEKILMRNGEVVFNAGKSYKPYQFGYSRTDAEGSRPICPVIEKFYARRRISHL